MKKATIILTISIFLFSCKKKLDTFDTVNLDSLRIKNFKPNPKIKKFKIISGIYNEEQIAKMDEKTTWYLNEPTFNPKTDTIKYLKNSIYISYLTFNNSCDELAGDFIEKGDSLKINLVNLNGYTCTERICDRVILKINNPENKKYKITKW